MSIVINFTSLKDIKMHLLVKLAAKDNHDRLEVVHLSFPQHTHLVYCFLVKKACEMTMVFVIWISLEDEESVIDINWHLFGRGNKLGIRFRYL